MMCVHSGSFRPARRNVIGDTVLTFRDLIITSISLCGINGGTFESTILLFWLMSGLIGSVVL